VLPATIVRTSSIRSADGRNALDTDKQQLVVEDAIEGGEIPAVVGRPEFVGDALQGVGARRTRGRLRQRVRRCAEARTDHHPQDTKHAALLVHDVEMPISGKPSHRASRVGESRSRVPASVATTLSIEGS